MSVRLLAAAGAALWVSCSSSTNDPGGSGGGGGGGSLGLSVALSGQGRVSSTPAGIDCAPTCFASFASGTSVGLSAIPASGWRFTGWSGACGGSAGCALTLSSTASVTATFERLPPPPAGTHAISITRVGSGSGYISSRPSGIDCGATCSATFTDGTSVTLTATADKSSTFAGWGGSCSGTGDCTLTLSSDQSVSARFDGAPPPPPDECAGLMPPAPGAANLSFAQPTNDGSGACGAGGVDGGGTLAFPWGGFGKGWGHLTFVSRDGAWLSRAADAPSTTPTEQRDGFITEYISTFSSALARFDSTGTRTALTPYSETFFSALDPAGGVSVAAPHYDHPGGTLLSFAVRNYDAHLAQRFDVQIPPDYFVNLAVDRAGNTLVVTGGPTRGAFNAVWVDHAGHVGPVFKLADTPRNTYMSVKLGERVDSGLFVALGGAWKLQLDALSTTTAPAPDWLASRPDTDLHMVRGGIAYGVLHPANASDCSNTIDIVAASGKVCGSQVFRAPAGVCAVQTIRIGWDGTVVQQLFNPAECTGSSCTCRWQWWTGLYKG